VVFILQMVQQTSGQSVRREINYAECGVPDSIGNEKSNTSSKTTPEAYNKTEEFIATSFVPERLAQDTGNACWELVSPYSYIDYRKRQNHFPGLPNIQ